MKAWALGGLAWLVACSSPPAPSEQSCTPLNPEASSSVVGSFSAGANTTVVDGAQVLGFNDAGLSVQDTGQNFQSGALLVSNCGDGLLRKVVAVQAGTQASTPASSEGRGAQPLGIKKIYLQTTPATLEDVVASGDATLQYGAMEMATANSTQLAPGASVQAVTGTLQLKNVTFSPASGISVVLNGSITQNLEPSVRLKFTGGTLEVLELGLTGSFGAGLSAKIVTNKKLDGLDIENQIAAFKFTRAFLVGAVPVVMSLEPRLIAGTSFGPDQALEVSAGINPTVNVNFKLRYDRNAAQKFVASWPSTSFNLGPSFNYVQPGAGAASTYARLAMDVRFYGLLGPTLETKPFIDLGLKPDKTATMKAGVATSAAIRAGFKVLGKGLEIGTSALATEQAKTLACNATACQ